MSTLYFEQMNDDFELETEHRSFKGIAGDYVITLNGEQFGIAKELFEVLSNKEGD